MRLVYTLFLVLAVATEPSFATQATPNQKKAHPPKKQPTAQVMTDTVVDTVPPQPPPPPPTPEQGPSSPPEVSYQAGQLVIVARNSTMGDVLNAVKQKTGASVEMPPASTERVVGKFGPGAPRDVMAQLLNGSHYDYVLLGSPADPGALKKVVLMARVNGPQPNAPQQAQQQNPNPAFRNPAYQQNLQAVPEVENDQPAEDTSSDTSQDVQPQEEEQPSADQPTADQPQPGQQPTVKTPEQLLRELQQQQQQQGQDPNGQPVPPQQPPQ